MGDFFFIIAFLSLYINCPITCFYEGLLYPQSSQRVQLTANYVGMEFTFTQLCDH